MHTETAPLVAPTWRAVKRPAQVYSSPARPACCGRSCPVKPGLAPERFGVGMACRVDRSATAHRSLSPATIAYRVVAPPRLIRGGVRLVTRLTLRPSFGIWCLAARGLRPAHALQPEHAGDATPASSARAQSILYIFIYLNFAGKKVCLYRVLLLLSGSSLSLIGYRYRYYRLCHNDHNLDDVRLA